MAPELLKKPPQAPPTFVATPTSIIEDTKRLIARSRNAQDDVANGVKPEDATFANALLPLAHDENAMALEAHIIGFYQAVSTDQKLRDASSEAEKLLDDFGIETSPCARICSNWWMQPLKRMRNWIPNRDGCWRREHKDYIRNGLGLPAGPKEGSV